MECPCCGTELVYEGPYGRFWSHQDGKTLGHIYRCPLGQEQSEECDSSVFHVAGSYYTDESGQLHEGYPC